VSSLPDEDLAHILHHTRELWEQLRGQRLFITGGTGFFGMWLLESFCYANDKLNLGARASVLTRSAESFRRKAPQLADAPAIAIVEGDVKTFAFPAGEFSHVIHAATEMNPLPRMLDPLEMFEGNIRGTRRVIDFCKAAGVRKLLFTSSGAAYGSQPSEMTHVPETFNGAPAATDLNSAYGQSKRACEFLCAAFAREPHIDVTITRCFAFAGAHLPLDLNFAIGNFVRDALNGGPIRIGGDGTPWRSYLYAADLAIWLWTILFRGQSARTYNVGSDVGITIADLAHLVAKIVNPTCEVIIAQEPDPKKPVARYVPSTARARAELGLDVSVDLHDAIRRMADWNRGSAGEVANARD
jgi:dTDP-glucose 4,6-dehydratase